LPERFRGGCSFGAATLAALKALPIGDVDASNCTRWIRFPVGTVQPDGSTVTFARGVPRSASTGNQMPGRTGDEAHEPCEEQAWIHIVSRDPGGLPLRMEFEFITKET
jgi:hypothetical protein